MIFLINKKQEIDFIGFTFKKDVELQRSHLKTALETLEENLTSNVRKITSQGLQRRGSDPLNNNSNKEIEQIPSQSQISNQNIPEPQKSEKIIEKSSALAMKEKLQAFNEKNSILNSKALANNPKLQALFGVKQNSPRDITPPNQNQFKTNIKPIENNQKEQNFANFLNKASPKAAQNNGISVNTKLQQQIHQLQNEQLLKKGPVNNINNNVDSKKIGNAYNFINKNEPMNFNKNFGENGSPKNSELKNKKEIIGKDNIFIQNLKNKK